MQELSIKPLLQYIDSRCHIDYSTCSNEINEVIRMIGVRNMLIQNQLSELIHKLESEGISAIVLKGSHLIQSIYPFGVRPLEDIDILIRKKNFSPADKIFRDLGYKDGAIGLDIWTHLEFSQKLTYFRDTVPLIPLDIHFALGPYPYLGRISDETLFENTIKISNSSGSYNVLNTEFLLIHLCLHLFQHQTETWQKSCFDIIAVLQNNIEKVDWSKFINIVLKYKLSLPVLYSLRKTCEMFENENIISIISQLEKIHPGIREQVIYQFSCHSTDFMEKYFIQFVTTPGIILKFKCLLRVIFPGRSFLTLNFFGSYRKYLNSLLRTIMRFIKNLFK